MTTLAVGLVLLAAAACGADAEDALGGALRPDEVVHIHDLVVEADSADVLVVTHRGLFRLRPDGSTEQLDVGRNFDVMGFASTSDAWIVSGHPQLDDDDFLPDEGPPLLGVVVSTDEGASWEVRSGLGEADLHAVAARGDQIWGIDSYGGRLLYSENGGRTVETLAELVGCRRPHCRRPRRV